MAQHLQANSTQTHTTARLRYRLWPVLLLCFALRLLFFVAVQPWNAEAEKNAILHEDARQYHELALGLLNDQGFAASNGEPETLRTPGYPLWVSFCYRLLGPAPWHALLLQIVLEVLACALLYHALQRVFGTRVAFYSALFYSMDPILILLSVELLSDGLFVFLLVGAFYLFVRSCLSDSPGATLRWLAGSAAVMAAATWVRPIAQYFPICMVLVLLVLYVKTPVTFGKQAAVYVAVFTVCISPWMLRNHAVFGRATMSVSRSYNLLALHTAISEMQRLGTTYRETRATLEAEAQDLIRQDGFEPSTLPVYEQMRYWEHVAWARISAHPMAYVGAYARGVLHSFANVSSQSFARMLGLGKGEWFDMKEYLGPQEMISGFLTAKRRSVVLIAVVVGLLLLAAYATALLGLCVAWRLPHQGALWYALGSVIYFVGLAGPAGLARFKLPAIPFYLCFSGIGVMYLLDRWARPTE